jgi:predicted nucleotidyltransferase component of viral defense system
MLHLNTIDATIHKILRQLSSAEYMNAFALAGGTSLALQIGHRKSIDIDMFAFSEVEMNEVSLLLQNDFKNIAVRKTTPVFIFCNIDDVKCDFVKYSKYPLLKPCFTVEGIRLFSIEDIVAMKLNAVCGRGTKKDFYDIYSSLKKFSLKEILEFYDRKYGADNSWMALKSLQYFEDADKSDDPVLLHDFPKWKEIKKYFIDLINNFEFDA